ncbi:MAG: response regulator [Paludisphaera borealis]|uniref:hybrid sensor histidine kinase/response regulator n=1 Tax=Paludisphaera borealis TaxID=1387353 RepID=UPI00284460A1|nr:response regulator [Paludisphaera borealis]MDR3619427.1 response regulator [Paludisphaera borealis]
MTESGCADNDLAERVLVLAPTTRDAAATEAVLRGVDVACRACRSVDQLCEEARRGAGTVILTEEAALSDQSGGVAALLRDQPPWSDLPLIVLTASGADSPTKLAALRAIGHTTLVKRPVQRSTLVSTVLSALRDRRRQYQARDYLRERELQAEMLREAKDSLAFALEAGRLGSWQLDLETGDLPCSNLCKRNFGLPVDAELTHATLLRLIHPDDRAYVEGEIRATLERGGEYNVEYRNVWPDGSEHWVHIRGRAAFDERGRPVRMAGVSLDVTERKQAEQALRTNVERLKTEDQRKNEFLAMLAHELRNPLSAISNSTEVAKRSQSKEHVEWSLKVIEKQVRHLSRMIDDLLDVSRITRGAIDLRAESLQLSSILYSAVETARPFIEEKKQTLSVDIDLDLEGMRIQGDATRLEQTFVNLLNNAAKYTNPGGRIGLSARRDDGFVVVRVSDTGVGMTPELLARAFDLFAQGDRAAARAEGGLGIGLTLVKSLVELHGGTVTASSAGPGEGSEFTVRLPLVEVAVAEGTSRKEADLNAAKRGARILVVDDNADTAAGMARLLKLLGHDVAVAQDGPTAVEAARSHRPDVVLLDIGLPGMDGHQVARALRNEGFANAVIVAVSGYGQEDDVRRSQAAGFNHHLVKPVDFDSLISLLGGL